MIPRTKEGRETEQEWERKKGKGGRNMEITQRQEGMPEQLLVVPNERVLSP